MRKVGNGKDNVFAIVKKKRLFYFTHTDTKLIIYSPVTFALR